MAAVVLATPAPAAVTVGHSGWSWGNPLPQGNTIRALEFEGARGYAAGDFGTVLVTEDSGATWTGAATGVTNALDRISIIDSDSVVVSGGCIVRRSDDGGRTFRRLPWTGSDARCPEAVVTPYFFANETGYLLLADGSILLSEDGGRTWSRRTAVPGTRAAGGFYSGTDIFFTSPSEGIATNFDGKIYRTTDGAVSWTLVGDANGVVADLEFVTPRVGFAVVNAWLLRTDDGGASWQRRASNVALTRISCADEFTCIATTSLGQSLMRTSDGGWTFVAVSPASTKLLAVAYAGGARVVAAGDEGATVASDDDGATWTSLSERVGLGFTRVRAASASVGLAVGPDGRLARTSDGGRSWAPLGVLTSEDVIDASFADSSVGYAVDGAGTVLRTDNGGSSWLILNTGYPATPQAVLALDPRTVLLIGGRGILRSTDGGESFARVRARIVARARLFNVDRAGRWVFAYGSKNIVASRNAGRTWKKVLRPRKALLASLDFATGRTGYALGQDGRLFKTRAGGRRWAEMAAIGTDDAVGMAFGSASHGYLVLSRWGGGSGGYLLRTSDSGRTWRPQLVSGRAPAAEGLAATGAETAFLLVDTRLLLFTGSGGDRGERSKVTLRASRRTVRRRGVVRLRGRVRGAEAGAVVRVGRRQRGESGWVHQDATVASNGRFATRWRVARTAAFVAQWAGDADSAGDGSRAVSVRVKRRKR